MAVAVRQSIDRCRTSTDRHVVSARAAEARWHSIRTPSGTVQRAAGCFAASTPQSDWRPGYVRHKAGKRRGCRQAVVPWFLGTPPRKRDFAWRRRKRSTSQSPERHCALACPVLLSARVGVVVPRHASGFKINEAREGSRSTKKCESVPFQSSRAPPRQGGRQTVANRQFCLADAQERNECPSHAYEQSRYGDKDCRPDSISDTLRRTGRFLSSASLSAYPRISVPSPAP